MIDEDCERSQPTWISPEASQLRICSTTGRWNRFGFGKGKIPSGQSGEFKTKASSVEVSQDGRSWEDPFKEG